jgi:Zn-dependent metalloprotease
MLYCIIPPYMLKQIALNGSPAQKNFALNALNLTAQLYGQRLTFAEALRDLIRPELAAEKYRAVYHADFTETLPGRLVRKEGDPPAEDIAVNEAYEGAGLTYDLFHDVYGRNSIDGHGMHLNSTVHYGRGYDNAFWNGQQMVYGDGDEDLPPEERLFNRFTASLDVIGHELTHGITQHEANLVYFGQSGALNESFSDIFGSLVKQRARSQSVGEADWIIGEGLFTPHVHGVGIRSLKAPGTAYDDPILGKDPQPAHMRDYVETSEDNGGVHINSGIPNHAFYVTAREIGGYAWEKAGQIWYRALTSGLTALADFKAAAAVTYRIAGELFGNGSLEQQAVRKGWQEVGLTVDGEQASGCLPALLHLLGK